MTEETISDLREWAVRNERMEFERDMLILRAKVDGDNMSEVARAAGLSRTHIYRLANEVYGWYETSLTFTFDEDPEKFWAAAKTVKTWGEFFALADK